MSSLFNYDNPIMQFLAKMADVLIVNLLWVFFSIPIFTIGASTTAMYYVTLKIVRGEDGYVLQRFWKAFKENFKKSTIIWLIFFAAAIILGIDIYSVLFIMDPTSIIRSFMLVLFIVLSIVWLAMYTYVFPIQARFDNTIKNIFIFAYFMPIRHLLSTICMAVVNVALLFLYLQVPAILMLFGASLGAYINSWFLNRIFVKYMPKQEEEDDSDELKPLSWTLEPEKVESVGEVKSEDAKDEGC